MRKERRDVYPDGRGNEKERKSVGHAALKPAGLGSELKSWLQGTLIPPLRPLHVYVCKVTSTCSRVALAANAKLNPHTPRAAPKISISRDSSHCQSSRGIRGVSLRDARVQAIIQSRIILRRNILFEYY